jgi:hypothetical protein
VIRWSATLIGALVLMGCCEEPAAPEYSVWALLPPEGGPDDPRVKCPKGATQRRDIHVQGIQGIWCLDGERREHGPERWWYPNGQRLSEHEYVHGELEGAARSWYADGTCRYQYTFRNGKLHGKAFGWHSNGRVSDASEWRDAKLLWMKWWDESGRPIPPPPADKIMEQVSGVKILEGGL